METILEHGPRPNARLLSPGLGIYARSIREESERSIGIYGVPINYYFFCNEMRIISFLFLL
jgi:hypothetical protein